MVDAAPPAIYAPGSRAGSDYRLFALLFLAIPCIGTAGLILQGFSLMSSAGHLPWPIAQWALTTPIGLVLTGLVLIVVFAPPWLVLVRIALSHALAGAIDATDLPPAERRTRARKLGVQRSRGDRWFGIGGRARVISVVMLLAGLFLCAAVAAILLIGMTRIPSSLDCLALVCPPLYPVDLLVQMGTLSGIGLWYLAVPWWLRRVERRCGIWLYSSVRTSQGNSYAYIRWPDVTSEAAVAALGRIAPWHEAPHARLFVLLPLAVLPMAVADTCEQLAQVWLQSHWIPG